MGRSGVSEAKSGTMILYCAVLLYVHVYSVPSLLLLLSLGASRACFASREEKEEEEESYLDAP